MKQQIFKTKGLGVNFIQAVDGVASRIAECDIPLWWKNGHETEEACLNHVLNNMKEIQIRMEKYHDEEEYIPPYL